MENVSWSPRQGSPDDPAGKETICGLGNRRRQLYLHLLGDCHANKKDPSSL